jgi:hypothetical protein
MAAPIIRPACKLGLSSDSNHTNGLRRRKRHTMSQHAFLKRAFELRAPFSSLFFPQLAALELSKQRIGIAQMFHRLFDGNTC